jgi:hypothetical protein
VSGVIHLRVAAVDSPAECINMIASKRRHFGRQLQWKLLVQVHLSNQVPQRIGHVPHVPRHVAVAILSGLGVGIEFGHVVRAYRASPLLRIQLRVPQLFGHVVRAYPGNPASPSDLAMDMLSRIEMDT